ncbi:MAG: AMP-binding protein [Gammaproteobacteria bacterium]
MNRSTPSPITPGRHPAAIAIRGGVQTVSYRLLEKQVAGLARRLDGSTLGLLVDNGPHWVTLDLAAQLSGACCVPMPTYFTDAQLRHIVDKAGIDQLITDQPARVAKLLESEPTEAIQFPEGRLASFQIASQAARGCRDDVAKITFTSGTTGQPRGVRLRQVAMNSVANSLIEVTAANEHDRSLCLLPLATLLENIAGVYAPLIAGAEVCIPSTVDTGMRGASGVDVQKLTETLSRTQPTSIILVPQLLAALVAAAESGWKVPSSLRMAAVGGAPVARQLLMRARGLGLPAFEGYGLSEAASVVALNVSGAYRAGTVGKPLPHTEISIAEDGEILVGGALFDGYIDERSSSQRSFATGDLGYLDAEGYLVLTGRKKSAYATSFGRNVLPDWIEREISEEPGIDQIAVFGEARPYNCAIVVTRTGRYDIVAAAIERANSRLPDYAQVRRFVLAHRPFTATGGELTASGKLRRHFIWSHYCDALESLYEEEVNAVS